MLKAYKHRIYPTKQQAILLDKHFGCCRFIYNLALETKNYAYITQRKNLTCIDLIKQITALKKECVWLAEVYSQSLQQAVINLDKAFTGFFKGHAAFPNFKKRTSNKSFRIPNPTAIRLSDNRILLPKFREGIRIIREREFKGEIKSATVSKSSTGRYFVSILVETGIAAPKKKPIKDSSTAGIDLGLKHFIVTSNGDKIDNPRHLQNSIGRLKILQRRASRKVKRSNNRKKANKRTVILYEKITNQRKDFLHKLSSKLISENQTLCFEDLNISGMVKNHCLAQSISSAGWGMFVEMCKYKAEWKGVNILQIPTFEPSTKVCSNCGEITRTLTLADREWVCTNCGSEHDRDINAAKVIKQYCLTKHSSPARGGEPVELPTLVGAMKQEVMP